MSKIKVINDRCPLQGECGRKKCEHKFCERECSYYQGNARPGAEIEDQQQAMEEEWEARMSAPSVLADTSAPSAPQEVEPVVVQGDTGTLVLLPVDKLLPHPDNPRKDLGDLQELADSIKANGILQNLTVVSLESEAAEWSTLSKQYQEHPTEEVRNLINRITANQPKDREGLFRVVIGHRRLAAAKLAGLTEVPCVISNMDYREQVRTMLMENIQRADLTVYEQAQGFQMMLDLGDTVEAIAKKAGFSQSTVRRRVKLLELDQQKFKASVERGAMLQDYAELEKIEDPELKNKVLDAIGTNNFRMTLKNAIDEEKDRKYIAEVSAALSEFATLIDTVDRSVMQYVTGYEPWNRKKKVERREDADTTKYYYTVSSRAVSLYRENVETSEDTEAKEEQERQKRELERREAALKKLSADAYALRLDFIKNYSKAKKNLPLIIQFAGLAMCEVTDNVDFEILVNLLDIACDLENEGLDMEAYNIALTERPEYTLLAIAYASVDYERLSYYQKNWRMENGQYGYHLDYEANEALDFLYHRLTDLGYEMSDEEKALQDGTHKLFREGEPAVQEDKEAAQDE